MFLPSWMVFSVGFILPFNMLYPVRQCAHTLCPQPPTINHLFVCALFESSACAFKCCNLQSRTEVESHDNTDLQCNNPSDKAHIARQF